MEKITFFVVCVLAAVFEGYKADSQLNLPSLEDTSEELSLSDRAELQIINLCTEVPTFYDELVSSFSVEGAASTEGIQKVQEFESKLRSKTEELKQVTKEYDERVSSSDPDAKTIQNLMSSAVDELVQSVSKINGELNTELGQNVESGIEAVEDRAKIIQNNLRPAIAKFQETCLLQTKDILNNILSDYEASLTS